MCRTNCSLVVTTALLLATQAVAQEGVDSFSEWVRNGTWNADARFRIENVDQSGVVEDALATTLRLQGGYETGIWNGLSALAEFEIVRALGSEQFNSTTNNQTQYPVVVDPDTTEVNQAYLYYRRDQLHVLAGRQLLPVRNERFLGSVDFRQNQQTYDALMAMYRGASGLTLAYSYMDRVRRFLSDDNPLGDVDMNAHTLHAEYELANSDTLTAYAHFLDMETLLLTNRSHRNFGVRYAGSFDWSFAKWLYHAEYADQSSHANGLAVIDADYVRFEFGPRFSNQWLLLVGVENLGGNGTYAFQTPFATGHDYNGRADIFAGGTPVTGLRDQYQKLIAPIGGTRVELAYHQFDADQSSIDYGNEIDVVISHRFKERFLFFFEFANYQAKNFATDTRKVSLSLRFEY